MQPTTATAPRSSEIATRRGVDGSSPTPPIPSVRPRRPSRRPPRAAALLPMPLARRTPLALLALLVCLAVGARGLCSRRRPSRGSCALVRRAGFARRQAATNVRQAGQTVDDVHRHQAQRQRERVLRGRAERGRRRLRHRAARPTSPARTRRTARTRRSSTRRRAPPKFPRAAGGSHVAQPIYRCMYARAPSSAARMGGAENSGWIRGWLSCVLPRLSGLPSRRRIQRLRPVRRDAAGGATAVGTPRRGRGPAPAAGNGHKRERLVRHSL